MPPSLKWRTYKTKKSQNVIFEMIAKYIISIYLYTTSRSLCDVAVEIREVTLAMIVSDLHFDCADVHSTRLGNR